jgi:hypothetical protein
VNSLKRLCQFLGIDRAIGFTVLARGWSIFAGLANVILIARFLSPSEQGYYYTFASLVSLQTLFELGFSFVVLQLAAHESAHLRLDISGTISGDELAHSRLASVLKTSVRWYSFAAILMAMGLLSSGLYFFSVHESASSGLVWRLPWICVALAATLTFQMDPVFSFIEGCGFVSHVARLRLSQAVLGSLLAWTALLLHHGLFAPAAIIAGQAIAGSVFLISCRRLLLPLLRWNTGEQMISWGREIWPFQWRIAVSFLCSYFIQPLFNPVLFAYRGAAEAGRMGMSMSIATALGTVAYAWVNTKASPFGGMIARREYASLDRIFFRALIQSASLLFVAQSGILLLFLILQSYYPRLTSRVLPMPIFALVLITTFCSHILFCEAAYLRAHKREPFLVLSIMVASLTAATTLVAGKLWGSTGITIGYLLWGGIFYLGYGTVVFIKCRRAWHHSPLEPLSELKNSP